LKEVVIFITEHMEPKRKIPKHPPAKVFAFPRLPIQQRILKGRRDKRIAEYHELMQARNRLDVQIQRHFEHTGHYNEELAKRRAIATDRMKKVQQSASWWHNHYTAGL